MQALILVAFMAFGAGSTGQETSLHGTVTTPDGAPAAGVQLGTLWSFEDEPRPVVGALTDGDGRYQLSVDTISGGSITSRTRDQQWTLTQTGNWNFDKVDLNGDGDFLDTDELLDDRTHNDVNELTGRDIDDSGTNDYTLTYDAAGNLTDDGENYEYVWDAFYRLRKVNDTSDQSLVVEYKYNGLDYRISRHEDTDTDGDVDGDDKWFHTVYDERWRGVATFRENDSDPKEQFLSHNAGLSGYGTGSYIDLVALRDKDANTAWTAASDGTLEQRLYYCQNWRADVVAVVAAGGSMLEWVKYSAYGVPFGLPGGDTDSDGDCDSTDVMQVQTWINASAYDVRGDIDLDGDVDSTDKSTIENNYQGTGIGRRVLSSSAVGSARGMTGYLYDRTAAVYHVRHRTMAPLLGRWLRRDPLEYCEGLSLYTYVSCQPLTRRDHTGLLSSSATTGPRATGSGTVSSGKVCNCSSTPVPGTAAPQNAVWMGIYYGSTKVGSNLSVPRDRILGR